MSSIVDLAEFRTGNVRVFAGRDRGQKVREAARLAALDDAGSEIEIRVPEDVFSVTSSFFLGMFGDTIRALGKSEFRRRYRFTGRDIERVLEDGIAEALRKESPL